MIHRLLTIALVFALSCGLLGAAEIPRPEHPLPQMQRSEWLNLNGVWEFAETADDNATEVFLNGEPLWKGERWNDNYAGFVVTEALRKSLRPGKNVIAVHCHQDEGGQFIDLAILLEPGAGGK